MRTARLDLLREALPYIQRFKGKTFVIKFSGIPSLCWKATSTLNIYI